MLEEEGEVLLGQEPAKDARTEKYLENKFCQEELHLVKMEED